MGEPVFDRTTNCPAALCSASSVASAGGEHTGGIAATSWRWAWARARSRSMGSVEQAKLTLCPGASIQRMTPGIQRSSKPA